MLNIIIMMEVPSGTDRYQVSAIIGRDSTQPLHPEERIIFYNKKVISRARSSSHLNQKVSAIKLSFLHQHLYASKLLSISISLVSLGIRAFCLVSRSRSFPHHHVQIEIKKSRTKEETRRVHHARSSNKRFKLETN
jgi:hypothetical protein